MGHERGGGKQAGGGQQRACCGLALAPAGDAARCAACAGACPAVTPGADPAPIPCCWLRRRRRTGSTRWGAQSSSTRAGAGAPFDACSAVPLQRRCCPTPTRTRPGAGGAACDSWLRCCLPCTPPRPSPLNPACWTTTRPTTPISSADRSPACWPSTAALGCLALAPFASTLAWLPPYTRPRPPSPRCASPPMGRLRAPPPFPPRRRC